MVRGRGEGRVEDGMALVPKSDSEASFEYKIHTAAPHFHFVSVLEQ